ncbi:response regulator [Paenibacillus piri]|uniref:Response regulator n=1 Tax=Paenibacillus piri TaxID=2547395 RepID=A0A4V2ZRV7_9BACL|nr:response regulator [Paenibacillus piri]TDF90529.1 response regulator [Paenibacillus piri]
MKMKMVVIDDEILVRRGVISSVDWDREGIEIAGEAADGRSGLEMIRQVQPDLVLTDIKMPYMDGLEMIKAVRTDYPHIRFVILSVLEDFQTVREALKLGAVDYMNKFMVEPDEMLQSVLRIKDSMLPMQPSSFHPHNTAKPEPKAANSEWIEWLQGEEREEPDRFIRQGDRFAVVVLELRDEARTGLRVHADAVKAAFEQTLGHGVELQCRFIAQDQPRWIVLCRSAHDKVRAAKLLVEGVTAWHRSCGGAFHVGISAVFTDTASRTEAYEQAQSALSLIFYRGDGICVYTPERPTSNSAPRFMELFALKQYLLQLEGHDDEAAEKAFHELFPERLDVSVAQGAVVDAAHAWVSSVILLLKDWGGELPASMRQESLYEHVHGKGTYSELREWSYYLHQLVRETLSELKAATHRSEIQRAIEYIKAHYQESIRVQDVAQYVHLSDNYFSNVFTKETGKTFSQYVQEIRVEKAKELLRGGKLEWFEVGELVGMDNPKYFSKVFKKHTGSTPIRFTTTPK